MQTRHISTPNVRKNRADGDIGKTHHDIDFAVLQDADIHALMDQRQDAVRAQFFCQQRCNDVAIVVPGRGNKEIDLGNILID